MLLVQQESIFTSNDSFYHENADKSIGLCSMLLMHGYSREELLTQVSFYCMYFEVLLVMVFLS